APAGARQPVPCTPDSSCRFTRSMDADRRSFMTTTRRGAAMLFGIAVVLLMTSPAAAQTVTGTVQGTVTDTSGAVLPGVSIAIRHVNTGAERILVTNQEGFYSAPFLQIGQYTVTAALAGFGSVAREGIQVGLNDTRIVNFTLNPRATETVTVKADAPPINAT